MKLLSVVVPCYNSEAYMENCIHSLLTGGPEVEIIMVVSSIMLIRSKTTENLQKKLVYYNVFSYHLLNR